jgi:transcriptional regulator with XRE-family HTH domain
METTTKPTPPPAAALTKALLSPAELARRANVSRQFVYRVLSGEKAAPANVRRAAEELTGLDADVLFGDPIDRAVEMALRRTRRS